MRFLFVFFMFLPALCFSNVKLDVNVIKKTKVMEQLTMNEEIHRSVTLESGGVEVVNLSDEVSIEIEKAEEIIGEGDLPSAVMCFANIYLMNYGKKELVVSKKLILPLGVTTVFSSFDLIGATVEISITPEIL